MESAGFYDLQRGERGSDDVHLSVLQLKTKKEQERLAALQERSGQAEKTLETLNQEQTQGREKVEQLSQTVEQYEERLEQLAPKIKDVEQLVGMNVQSTEELLPEAAALETGKHYRSGKAFDVVDKLRKWLLALYRKYLDLKQDYQNLRQKYAREAKAREYYEERTWTLEKENGSLKEKSRDLDRVRLTLGGETVDNAIEWAKDREMAELAASSQRRRTVSRTDENRSEWDAR